jgi:hypothetical protein
MDLACLKTKGYQYQRYITNFYNADNESVLYISNKTFAKTSNEKMHYLMYLIEWNVNKSTSYKYIIFYGGFYDGERYHYCVYGRNDKQYCIDILLDYFSEYVVKYYNNSIIYICSKFCNILMRFDLYGNLIYCNSQDIELIQEMKDSLKKFKNDFPKDIYT